MKRILCVWFPGWPIQRFRHAQPALSQQALVLYATARRGQLVTACSPGAARAGIVPGMPLAEARALGADAHFAVHEPRADHASLRSLAEWCQQFTPVVAVEEVEQPGSLLLDITGCASPLRDEKALARQISGELGRYGYWARVAIADNPGTAWAVAHHGTEPSRASSGEPVIVPRSQQKKALRPLAVEALRLSPAIVQLLHQLDVRRIGQLLDLPSATLPSRFGKEIQLRIDQALGHIAELLKPEPVPEPVEASLEFESTTDDLQIIETVFEQLLRQILERLLPRQQGIQRLLCSLQLATKETIPVSIGLLRPSASAPHLMSLVRLYFERLRIPAEVAGLVMRAAEVVPLEFAQAHFFEGEIGKERWRAFPELIERLSNRLGEKAILRSRLLPDVQPERACRFEPWLGPNTAPALPDPGAFSAEKKREFLLRPPCLKSRPISVVVVTPGPGGPPLRFVWQDQCYIVAHSWGPERIETGWWRGRDIRRDYYLVESSAGKRFWLFQTRTDERWFLHGTYA